MKQFVIGIDWYGPYTRDEAIKASGDYQSGGVYLVIGTPIGKGNHKRKPQYIGTSRENLVGRCTSDQHHVLTTLKYDGGLWLGQISTAEPSGRRSHVTPSTLRYAEWLHAFYMKLPKNTKLRARPPPKPATILNRWWKTDYVTPRYHRPHPAWPDLIDFTGNEHRSRSVWFGGKQVIHRPVK